MNSKEKQRIQLLTKLELSSELFIRFLLPEIRDIFQATSCTFIQVDNNKKIIGAYDLAPQSLNVANKYYQHKNAAILPNSCQKLTQWLLQNIRVSTSQEMFPDTFYESHFYKDIWKPMNYRHAMFANITYKNDHKGIILLYRNEQQKAFSKKEKQYMEAMLPYIEDGIKSQFRFDKNVMLNDFDEDGLLIFNTDGELFYSNAQGRRLITLIVYPSVGNNYLIDSNELLIPNTLINKIKNLDNTSSDTNLNNEVIWEYTNEWGRFVFAASHLEKNDLIPHGLISVNIKSQVPLSVKVMKKCEDLKLTSKQTQICLQLIKGNSYNCISQYMCISSHTVVDHVRKLYDKLNVTSRTELVTKLTAD